MNRPLALSLVLLTSVALACTSSETKTADTTKMAAPAPAPAPAPPSASAKITSPANGDTVKGPDVTVKMSAVGFKLAKANSTHEDGIGHFHLFLDTAVTAEATPIPANSATHAHIGTGDSTYTFKGVKPGAHTLIVVAGDGTHVPMATSRDTIHFVVK